MNKEDPIVDVVCEDEEDPKGTVVEVKESQNRKAATLDEFIKVAREVVEKKSWLRVNGVMLDLFTAGTVCQVVDASLKHNPASLDASRAAYARRHAQKPKLAVVAFVNVVWTAIKSKN